MIDELSSLASKAINDLSKVLVAHRQLKPFSDDGPQHDKLRERHDTRTLLVDTGRFFENEVFLHLSSKGMNPQALAALKKCFYSAVGDDIDAAAETIRLVVQRVRSLHAECVSGDEEALLSFAKLLCQFRSRSRERNTDLPFHPFHPFWEQTPIACDNIIGAFKQLVNEIHERSKLSPTVASVLLCHSILVDAQWHAVANTLGQCSAGLDRVITFEHRLETDKIYEFFFNSNVITEVFGFQPFINYNATKGGSDRAALNNRNATQLTLAVPFYSHAIKRQMQGSQNSERQTLSSLCDFCHDDGDDNVKEACSQLVALVDVINELANGLGISVGVVVLTPQGAVDNEEEDSILRCFSKHIDTGDWPANIVATFVTAVGPDNVKLESTARGVAVTDDDQVHVMRYKKNMFHVFDGNTALHETESLTLDKLHQVFQRMWGDAAASSGSSGSSGSENPHLFGKISFHMVINNDKQYKGPNGNGPSSRSKYKTPPDCSEWKLKFCDTLASNSQCVSSSVGYLSLHTESNQPEREDNEPKTDDTGDTCSVWDAESSGAMAFVAGNDSNDAGKRLRFSSYVEFKEGMLETIQIAQHSKQFGGNYSCSGLVNALVQCDSAVSSERTCLFLEHLLHQME